MFDILLQGGLLCPVGQVLINAEQKEARKQSVHLTMVLHNNMYMWRRIESPDRFSNWRLDIDNMSYEQLLELGDKIGYVNTGLKEDEISRCVSKIKGSMKNDLAPNVPKHVDNKCSICQEEYEADEEMGKLCCGHSFHIQCIKQWLLQKNACPVCKTEATPRC